MKPLNPVVLCLIVFMQPIFTYSAVYINSISAYHEFHTIDSSRVYCIVNYSVPNSPCWVEGTTINTHLDTVQLSICVQDGNATTICTTEDTFDLGVRQNGFCFIQATLFTSQNHCLSAFQSTSAETFLSLGNVDIGTTVSSIEASLLFKEIQAEQIIVENLTRNSIEIHLVSLEGKMNRVIETSASKIAIDISTLPAGLYFAVLQNEQGRVVRKFVKEAP